MTDGSRQESTGSADEATQGAEAHSQRVWSWVEASVWTERMSCRRRALSARPALVNGVVVSKTRLRHEGGKWYSVMDKVYAPKTLTAAWTKVRVNKGAAGVDGQSIGRFAAKAELYLSELSGCPPA